MIEHATRTPSARIGGDVLAAALELLDTEGPDHFTVRAIAKCAGVAPMALYNHFDGKNGVLEAIWLEGFSRLRDVVARAGGDPMDDLRDVGINYRAFALSNRPHYTVMFMHRFVGFEPSAEGVVAAARAFGALVEQVDRAQRAGHFAGRDASDVAQMLWSTSHGFVSLEILGVNFAEDPDATYAELVAGLLRGLA